MMVSIINETVKFVYIVIVFGNYLSDDALVE